MKLFAFYIGGRIDGANIEVHDVRVCAGESVEACYDDLRAQWWGAKQSLHLDCWGELVQADGHDISLHRAPSASGAKLYFVNLGGYHPVEFAELHSNLFVVAQTEDEAKSRALKLMPRWNSRHKDCLYDVEQTLCVNDLFKGAWHIHLRPAVVVRPFTFECGYRPIGRKTAMVQGG